MDKQAHPSPGRAASVAAHHRAIAVVRSNPRFKGNASGIIHDEWRGDHIVHTIKAERLPDHAGHERRSVKQRAVIAASRVGGVPFGLVPAHHAGNRPLTVFVRADVVALDGVARTAENADPGIDVSADDISFASRCASDDVV